MIRPPTYTMQEIVAFCTQALPALAGEVRPSENAVCGGGADEMALLFGRLSSAHPEAGAVYWGCRAWLLWTWQPVYLGVWAASVKGVSPDLGSFRHRTEGLFTAKFHIAEQNLPVLPRCEAVFQTASRLKAWVIGNLPLLQPHYPLGDRMAEYFLGDTILNALSSACLTGLLPPGETDIMRRHWQEALGLRCNGEIVWDEAAQSFRVTQAACCQHYRRADGGYCGGCPKTRKKGGCKEGK